MSESIPPETEQDVWPTDIGPFIGIDVGGTKIMGVAVLNRGRIAHRIKAPTPSDPSQVGNGIMTVINSLSGLCGPPMAIGVGVPGLVDNDGVLRYGPNVPGVVGLDIAKTIAATFDVPVAVENDAGCAAIAEHRLGSARGFNNAIIVTQGTGIGGGLIINGELLRGANGFAGEPGHMLIDDAGPRCACGNDGCWEAVASGAGLANLARGLMAQGRGQNILALADGDATKVRGEHISEALTNGDPDAEEVIDQFASWVARGLGSLVNLLDPQVIVLGGGLTVISGTFLLEVEDRMAATVMGAEYRPQVPVVAAAIGAEAGAVGAAVLAAEKLGADLRPPGRYRRMIRQFVSGHRLPPEKVTE